MAKTIRGVVARFIEWWWLDVPVAAAIVTVVAQFTAPGTGADLLGQLSLNDRRGIYTDALQLATLFGAFTGIAFTLYLTLSGKGVRSVKGKVGVPLLRLWIAAITLPWVCAASIVLAKVLDRGGVGSDNQARTIVYAAALVVGAQLVRTAWVFYQLALIDLNGDVPARPTAARPIAVVKRPAS